VLRINGLSLQERRFPNKLFLACCLIEADTEKKICSEEKVPVAS